MNKTYSSFAIARKIWLNTNVVFGLGWVLFGFFTLMPTRSLIAIPAFMVSSVASLPVIIVLWIAIPFIKQTTANNKLVLLVLVCLLITVLYSLAAAIISTEFSHTQFEFFNQWAIFTAILFGCSLIAILLCRNAIDNYLSDNEAAVYHQINQPHSITQINTNMETFNQQQHNDILLGSTHDAPQSSNKTVIKAITTAVLILAMMIPAVFVSNLVMERQANQTEALNRIAISGNTQQSAKNFTLVHTHDNNIKTMRATKYAILVIGLTFALFFIIELVQKNPMHPVQYVLVGLALVMFYTLLLSISEFIQFNSAYLIAAVATIALIVLYVKSHFKNWKAAGALGGILTGLYTFIFVIISLEDAALLVGSVGLFIVLAIIMYATRNINWYNPSFSKEHKVA